MIKTLVLLEKINSVIFNNLLTTDAELCCRIETIKSLKSIILLYRNSWNVEYMPTDVNEVENCVKFYDIDHYAVKGLKKLSEDIKFFLNFDKNLG